jgi:hypothetical protein
LYSKAHDGVLKQEGIIMRLAATYVANHIKNALETNNIDELMRYYTEDAKMTIIDQNHPPSKPLELSGRDAIRSFMSDIESRHITHKVEAEVYDDNHLAFTETCEYPNGEKVAVSSMCELRDGRIENERVIQAWDS